jgi:quinol-cytochrome oxidoreductase complex cytochrome b subunit
MSEQTKFDNKIVQWVDDRLPVFSILKHSAVDYPTPKNLNYWWNFGSLAGMMLVIMILTGVFLAMNYAANAGIAFISVEHIMRDVNYGWLLRYLTMMATAFMGYVLPWGQMSFWGATVITSLFSAIPVVGDTIVTWLWGGFAVDNPTLNRFFALHYLLPFIIVALVGLHLMALHTVKSNNPLGIDVKGPQDTIPFHPYYTVKDLVGVGVFLILYLGVVFYAPNLFGEPDNYTPANPMATPSEIVPEWYFLPFYAILRSIPDKLGGVCCMFGAIVILFFLPWIDCSKVRSAKFRPIYKQVFWIFLADCFLLGYVGAHKPEGNIVLIGQLATAGYFAFFPLLWIIGKLEKPRPLPQSIAQPVLKPMEKH